jgi:hypothetical protein
MTDQISPEYQAAIREVLAKSRALRAAAEKMRAHPGPETFRAHEDAHREYLAAKEATDTHNAAFHQARRNRRHNLTFTILDPSVEGLDDQAGEVS